MKKYNLEKKIENVNIKITNTNELVKKTDLLKINIDYNTKITKIEDKIPSVTGAVTIPAITTKATDKLKTKTSEITNLAIKANLNEKNKS